MSSPREEVLGRIRAAVGDSPAAVPVPREYRRTGEHAPGSPELLAQLVDRLVDYRAQVIRCEPDDEAIGRAVHEALAGRGIAQVLTPPGAPAAWTSALPDVVQDDVTLDARALDRIGAVVTGSVLAISETGTIVLDGSARCGRRAATLVPDVHVCVVSATEVVQTVPEGLARLDPLRPLTFISGPSATSDIELSRVEGVHGPRTLIVVLTT